MGRPTKYKPRYCQKLIDFFDVEPYEERKIPHYKGSGKNREHVWDDIKLIPRRLPTLRKFAKSIKVSYVTTYEWINKYKEFSNAFTHAKEIRKEFLIDNALAGMYPPNTFKFVAVNLTDMRDVTEVIGDLYISVNEKFTEKPRPKPKKRGNKSRTKPRIH